MFAVIYQSYIKPGCDQDYQRLWHQIAGYFISKRGAIGSCLHRTSDGMWVAYSRWPSKQIRDGSWLKDDEISTDLPSEIRSAISELKNCLDLERKVAEICLEVIDDLLVQS